MQDCAADRPETTPGTLPSPAGGFVLCRRDPLPAFRHAVEGFCGYAETLPGHYRQTEPAALLAPMIISFGAPFAIALGRAPLAEDRFGTFAAGLFAGPVLIESFGASACVQVNFTPHGARQFFGLPMHELTGRMLPLDALLGGDADRLRQRLGEEPDWQRRLDLIEAFVYRRLAAHPSPSAAVSHALRGLQASRGAARIADICNDLGCSRKHLAQRFREEVGLAPKTMARMMRFQQALQLAQGGTRSWADIAAECAYADQAHLVREFVEFAGETPSAWRARVA